MLRPSRRHRWDMLVYLDNCTIQRPLDDRSRLRIAVEAECVAKLVAQVGCWAIEGLGVKVVSPMQFVAEIER